MKLNIYSLLQDTILSGITDKSTQIIMSLLIMSVGLIILSLIIDFMFRRLFIRIINGLMRKTHNLFLIAIADARVFNIISLFSFAIVFDIGSAFVSYKGNDSYNQWFANALLHCAYFVYYLAGAWSVTRIITAINLYYERRFDSTHEYPIYGYIKMIQFALWCVAILLYISFALDKSPLKMLTGIGAISAFVILIFKDTFLGLVSSIQATANQIVKLGDWVNIPKYNIDGEVIYISINTIKVRNWDNTVTSIPTFALTAEAIHNWQAMVNSSARRIFRAVYIDAESIVQCDDKLVQTLSAKYSYIQKMFVGAAVEEGISNLGLFRLYMNNYLENNQLLNHDHPNLVRYLAPTPYGIPLQVYAFSKEVYLENFEETQSQIFEHIFLALNDFKLKIFQSDSAAVVS